MLWNDLKKELNIFFATFLILVMVWNLGSLLTAVVSLVDDSSTILKLSSAITELGFVGSSIAVYALAAIVSGVHSRRFRVLSFASLALVLSYQVVLIVADAPLYFESNGNGFNQYRFQPLSALFYFMFDTSTLYLIWRYRHKIHSTGLFVGLNLFAASQSLGFLNPELGIVSLSITLAGIATLVISFAILRREIINPLAERVVQVEAVHKVSLAISSHIALDKVLDQIATQAAGWLNADAAGIFLKSDSDIELSTVYNLPTNLLHMHLSLGEGIAGCVAQTQQSIFVENYERDWKSTPDIPLARETFGSVIAVPLVYSEVTIGVLIVIAGRQGRLFQKQDAHLLELLASQASVAITHSRLFAEQERLNRQVKASHIQLETVLTSTENPVIAVDRKVRLIFANPAALKLIFPYQDTPSRTQSLIEVLPSHVFPLNIHETLRELRYKGEHIYELNLNNQTYLCHVAPLGEGSADGWVAVLNDVSQLKELDRLKSDMIRMTSHDLKNPLQAAMANLELLNEDLEDLENSEVHVSLMAINTQMVRMNKIVSGILDLERIKGGKLHTELCMPSYVIDSALSDVSHLAAEKQVALDKSVDAEIPAFQADPQLFQRALVNLLENGIKFTNNGGRISISAMYKERSILFQVADNGIGIVPDLHPFVFDRFWRGGQRGQKGAEHIAGTGLGLSLVKTIVESHHGEIWFSSEVGKGTVFYLKIPVSTENSVCSELA
ncbi:MAG: ATP-binding protein [Anaerolineae bacterium]